MPIMRPGPDVHAESRWRRQRPSTGAVGHVHMRAVPCFLRIPPSHAPTPQNSREGVSDGTDKKDAAGKGVSRKGISSILSPHLSCGCCLRSGIPRSPVPDFSKALVGGSLCQSTRGSSARQRSVSPRFWRLATPRSPSGSPPTPRSPLRSRCRACCCPRAVISSPSRATGEVSWCLSRTVASSRPSRSSQSHAPNRDRQSTCRHPSTAQRQRCPACFQAVEPLASSSSIETRQSKHRARQE